MPEVLCCSLPCATNDFTNAAHSLQRLEVTCRYGWISCRQNSLITFSIPRSWPFFSHHLLVWKSKKVWITPCTTPCVSLQICIAVTVWIHRNMKGADLSLWQQLFRHPRIGDRWARVLRVLLHQMNGCFLRQLLRVLSSLLHPLVLEKGNSRTHKLNTDNLPLLKEVPQNLRAKVRVLIRAITKTTHALLGETLGCNRKASCLKRKHFWVMPWSSLGLHLDRSQLDN